MTTTSRRVWTVPVVLAVLTMGGLLSALLGEHLVWKAISWLALAVPVVVGAWMSRPRGKGAARR